MALGLRIAAQKLRQSSFVRDVLLLSGGTGIAQTIAISALPLLSRLYSPEDFGLLAIYISIVTLLAVFSSFNYELMIMQTRSHRSASQLVWLILAISICTAGATLVIVCLFRLQIATLLGVPELAAWLWTAPALLLTTAAYQALHYWKMRLRQFSVISYSLIARTLVFAVVATVAALIPQATTLRGAGLMLAFIISEIAKTLVLLVSVRNRDSKQFAPVNRRRIAAVGRRYGTVAATMSMSWAMAAVFDRIPQVLIASFFGAATLGFYAMVGRIVTAPSRLVTQAISDVFRQRASELHRKQGRFDTLALKTFRTTAAIAVVPFVVAIIFAPSLFSILLGSEWKEAGHYASILLVGEFLAFAIGSIDSSVVIVKDKRFIFFWSLTRLLLTLGLFPLLHLGAVDFVGFLWALVGIRILMLSLEGAASYLCAKGGRPLRWPAPQGSPSL